MSCHAIRSATAIAYRHDTRGGYIRAAYGAAWLRSTGELDREEKDLRSTDLSKMID